MVRFTVKSKSNTYAFSYNDELKSAILRVSVNGGREQHPAIVNSFESAKKAATKWVRIQESAK